MTSRPCADRQIAASHTHKRVHSKSCAPPHLRRCFVATNPVRRCRLRSTEMIKPRVGTAAQTPPSKSTIFYPLGEHRLGESLSATVESYRQRCLAITKADRLRHPQR